MKLSTNWMAKLASIFVLVCSWTVLISGCSEEAEQGDCIDVICESPPADECDGDAVVSYAATGTCESGDCVYDEASRETCAGETPYCFQGTCTDQDPCEGVTCGADDAPSSSCDGDNVVSYDADSGQCQNGVCEYDEASRESCSGDTPHCVSGECAEEQVDPEECVVDGDPLGEDSLEGDFQALNDIYTATDGENWTHNDGWASMTADTMGDAYGVEVDDDGRVVSINLEENNLVNSTVTGTGSSGFDQLEVISGREFPESVQNLKRLTYFNVKANAISGPIPQGFMELEALEWLLLSGRTEQDPRHNSENHPGKIHAFDHKNMWTGSLPQNWCRLQNLFAVEISNHQFDHGLTGPLPQSLFDLPNLELILLYSNHFTGTIPEITNPEESKIVFIAIPGGDLEGPLPESWSQLSAPYGKYFRFNGNQGISGTIPQSYANIQDLRVFFSGGTSLHGPFPDFLFHDGNANLNYFSPPDDIEGTLPDSLPAENTTFPRITIFSLNHRDLDGPIPNWVSWMRLIQFNFNNNQFTHLADNFYNPNAPIYHRVRNIRINNSEITGELPDTLFAAQTFEGEVESVDSSTSVTLDLDLDVVESGTITSAS